jgi:ABC-type dipeptide/oligopeptide/nickel transport system permease subunit
MLMLAIIFALAGAALGLRFKALVLGPASCFALGSPVLTNSAYGYPLPVLAMAMITTLMALQIGYLLGFLSGGGRG